MFKCHNRIKQIGMFCLAGAMALSMIACNESDDSGKIKDPTTITNVSYDPTRELYAEYNHIFKEYYKDKTGVDVEIKQSHGGSGAQARSVIEGADADVVTLALAHDITLIEKEWLIDSGWMDEFDLNSSPYTSTIVFLVRKGNEKGIKDWDDLVRKGIDIIAPDPKSSGGACWNFLAAWHYADKKFGGDEARIMGFMEALYDNVTVMDSGAREATNTFVEKGHGDVLIAWENEAIQTIEKYNDEYEIISPSISILAQPSVAIVDENVRKNGTEELAREYLAFLYSNRIQRLIGRMGYRPSNKKILAEYGDKFDLDMELCSIEDFGGWDFAYKQFFENGAIFDEICEEQD